MPRLELGVLLRRCLSGFASLDLGGLLRALALQAVGSDQSLNLGRFSEEEEELNMNPQMMDEDEEECEPCSDEESEEDEYTFSSEEEFEAEDEESEEQAHRIRRWGDEVVEKKKVNAGLQAYLDKKAGKKEDKEEKGGKKAKPDFLDLDKDGDKKETMKKAAKDAKDGKEEKGGKGLTAAQKKLPAGLQKAIAAKKK
jgi:hypothetical protein